MGPLPRCIQCGERIWSDDDTVHSSGGPVHRGHVTPLYAIMDGEGRMVKDGHGNLRLYHYRADAEAFVEMIHPELGFSIITSLDREVVQTTIFRRK